MKLITQLLTFLLLLVGFSAVAEDNRGGKAAAPAMDASITKLMEQIFSKSNRADEKLYLIESTAESDNKESILQHQVVNGALPLYGEDIRQKLTGSLQKFNSTNAESKISLFAYTARYLLGYSTLRGIDQSEQEQRLMNALTNAVQKENQGKGSQEVFKKAFIAALDDRFDQYSRQADNAGNQKVIVFFYVEAVLGSDYKLDEEIQTAHKKKYYSFIWTRGLSVLEEEKLVNAAGEFRSLIKIQRGLGLENPEGLVACTDKIGSLYKSVSDYNNPKDAIQLVWSLSEERLAALTVPERLRLMRAMNKVSLTDMNNPIAVGQPGATGEPALIRLVSTVKERDYKEYIDSLEAKPQLMLGLLDKLNDAGIGNENYSAFVLHTLRYFYQVKPFNNDWESLEPHGKSFAFHGFGMFDGARYNIIDKVAGGYYEGVINLVGEMAYAPYTLHPFEYVGVVGNLELPGIKFIKDEPQANYFAAVPAFYLRWLVQKKETSVNKELAIAAVAIPMNAYVLGTGAVMLSSGSKALRVIGALDIITTTGSTALQVTPIKDIVRKKYGGESPEYATIDAIDKALLFYNGARAIADLSGLPGKLDEAAVLWQKNGAKLRDEGVVTQKQAAELDKMFLSGNRMPGTVRGADEVLASLNPAVRKRVEDIADQATRNQLLDDLARDPEGLLKAMNQRPELIDSWKAIAIHTELRKTTKFLENVDGYSNDLFKQLEADLLNPKWADELKTLFRESPEDVTNVWKQLKDDPAYAWEISKTGDVRWQRWGQREFFKDITALGKKFEEVAISKVLDKTSDLYVTLKSSLNNKGFKIDDYEIFQQVQLKYSGDNYFVGDIVLIRKEVNAFTGQVKIKAVIIETKLRNTTNLTVPQANAVNKVKGVDKSLIIRSEDLGGAINKSNILAKNSSIEVEDFIKVWSDGSGEVFSGLNSLIN